MNDLPAVDVVVPCYNYGRFLEECVTSVLEQCGVSLRVLIIDDCSSDDTPRIGMELARTHSNVTFKRHATNAGHIQTYNEGIEWLRAPYFLLLSADDLLTPGSLARAVDVFERHADVGMVFGNAVVFKDSSELRHRPLPVDSTYSVISGLQFIEDICSAPSNPIAAPAVLVRTQLQRALGHYDPRLPHTGDLEMWLRFAARSNLAKVSAPQAYRREHETNMFRRYTAPTAGEQQHMKAVFDVLLERGFLDESLARRAYRGIAMDCLWRASTAFERGEDEKCDVLLQFGLSVDQALANHPSWRRLAWKRRLGRWPSRLLVFIAERLPRVTQPSADIAGTTAGR